MTARLLSDPRVRRGLLDADDEEGVLAILEEADRAAVAPAIAPSAAG
jgi:hypothetical protein